MHVIGMWIWSGILLIGATFVDANEYITLIEGEIDSLGSRTPASHLKFIVRKFPDTLWSIETVQYQLGQIRKGYQVPTWFHETLVLMSESASSEGAMIDRLVTIAPTPLYQDRDFVRDIAHSWLRFCVRPLLRNPVVTPCREQLIQSHDEVLVIGFSLRLRHRNQYLKYLLREERAIAQYLAEALVDL